MKKRIHRTVALFKPGDQVLTKSTINNNWIPGVVISEPIYGRGTDNAYNVRRKNGITAVNVDQKNMKLNEDPSTFIKDVFIPSNITQTTTYR